MALDATARAENVRKSIFAHLGPLLEAQSLTVDYGKVQQNLSSESEYVQMRLLNAGGGDYAGQASSTRRGIWKTVLLSFNIFLKKTALTNSYRAVDIRDVILGQAELGSEFDLIDYDTTGNPAVGVFRVEGINDDTDIVNNEGYYQYNLTLRLDWLEKF